MRNRLRAAAYRLRYPGRTFTCNFCGFAAGRFRAIGVKAEVLHELNVVGGGYRANAECPRCGAGDRDRLVRIALENDVKLPPKARILHVAPERPLNRFLRERFNGGVIVSDLYPERYAWARPALKMDLTKCAFQRGQFDLVVCNHVLEHIPDDAQALQELAGLLRPGGYAVLQVPYTLKLENTIEDPSVTDEDERLRRFGQRDHVRLYALEDFIRRVESGGLKSRFLASDHFAHFARYALSDREGVLLFQKPE